TPSIHTQVLSISTNRLPTTLSVIQDCSNDEVHYPNPIAFGHLDHSKRTAQCGTYPSIGRTQQRCIRTPDHRTKPTGHYHSKRGSKQRRNVKTQNPLPRTAQPFSSFGNGIAGA